MGFIQEFKEFALKGNAIDLAVGIVIGTAFNKVVSSLVNDVIMPPIGLLLGGTDFSQLYINLSDTVYPTLSEAISAGAPVIKYGLFITTLIDFLIVALTIFLVIKLMNRLSKMRELEKLKEVHQSGLESIKKMKEKLPSLKNNN